MATFDINEHYSAAYSVDREANGYSATGDIVERKSERLTGVTFQGVGRTMGSAIKRAMADARRVCPLRPPSSGASAAKAKRAKARRV